MAKPGFPRELEVFHYLANIYGWDYHTFKFKTPPRVIRGLVMLLQYYTNYGFLGHHETMAWKAIVRTKAADDPFTKPPV